MKINIYENEIEGEVQDGSIDLTQEFEEKLRQLRMSLDSWHLPTFPDVFGDEIHKVGINIRFDFDGDEKIIKWELKGYFKETPEKPINFVIPRDTIAKAAIFLVEYILSNFSEIMSYPKEILSQYRIKSYDFDVFTNDGLIAGQYFMRENDRYDYREAFDREYSLLEYFQNIRTIAETYVLPYEFKFAENYAKRYYHHLNKARKFGKAYQSGTFEGHNYKFVSFRATISPAYRSFNKETLTLESDFHVSVDYSLGMIIDGHDYTKEIYDAPWDDNTSFGKAYRKDLIEQLKPILSSHGLSVS
jgi:hypothetical protein